MAKRFVFLAEGFEEIEAISILDVLTRGGVETIKVAVGVDGLEVTGAHGVTVKADIPLAEVSLDAEDSVILPGGLPGAQNLWENERVLELVRQAQGGKGVAAAICAAPAVLGEAGILKGRKVTSYPGFQEKVAGYGAEILQDVVVRDGNVITSKGPGTAVDFGLALVEEFVSKEKAEQVGKDLLVIA